MKFYIQFDGNYVRRAHRPYYRQKAANKYDKINHAIAFLKTRKSPHKLVFTEDTTVGTLLYFEGQEGAFNASKKKTLIQVGALMYVPKSVTRKTTRKRKKTCKKSKSSTVLKTSVKFTLPGFNTLF